MHILQLYAIVSEFTMQQESTPPFLTSADSCCLKECRLTELGNLSPALKVGQAGPTAVSNTYPALCVFRQYLSERQGLRRARGERAAALQGGDSSAQATITSSLKQTAHDFHKSTRLLRGCAWGRLCCSFCAGAPSPPPKQQQPAAQHEASHIRLKIINKT